MASTTRTQQAAQERPPKPLATIMPVRRKLHLNPFRIVIYTMLTFGAIVFVWPFLWMVSTSLQSTGDIVRGRFLPSGEFISLHETTADQLSRTLGDYLEADNLPSYLVPIRSQIESSQRQQSMTLHE